MLGEEGRGIGKVNSMSEHFNKLTPAQDERLAKLAEECAEVIQSVCKILRHGYESYDPTDDNGGAGDNRRDLMREIADIQVAVTKLTNARDLSKYVIDRRYLEAINEPERYMHHQDKAA